MLYFGQQNPKCDLVLLTFQIRFLTKKVVEKLLLILVKKSTGNYALFWPAKSKM
jgi:hypothetical protein